MSFTALNQQKKITNRNYKRQYFKAISSDVLNFLTFLARTTTTQLLHALSHNKNNN